MSPPLRNSVAASEGRSQGTQVAASGARERRVCGRQESMPKNRFEFHAVNCRATNCLRWKGSRGFVRKNGCGIPQSRLRSGVSATANAEPTTREAGHRFSSESGNGRISSTGWSFGSRRTGSRDNKSPKGIPPPDKNPESLPFAHSMGSPWNSHQAHFAPPDPRVDFPSPCEPSPSGPHPGSRLPNVLSSGEIPCAARMTLAVRSRVAGDRSGGIPSRRDVRPCRRVRPIGP